MPTRTAPAEIAVIANVILRQTFAAPRFRQRADLLDRGTQTFATCCSPTFLAPMTALGVVGRRFPLVALGATPTQSRESVGDPRG